MTRREFRGAAQIPGLKLPGGGGGQLKLPIPGMKELDKLLKGDPPLTTSLKHAQPDVPLLDGLALPNAAPLQSLPRTESGAYRLKTGRFYADLQSYCLKAGLPAPTQGYGLLYGGFQGPKAGLIQQILQSAERFPQVPQPKIQELLWAIIARARFKDLTDERKQLAVLLAPKEVALWQADVVMNFPQKLLKDAVDKLPPEAKMVFEAEQRLRDAFHDRAGFAFEDLERIAVPNTELPKTLIPQGRWSYHKGGFFTRMIASGYKKTHVEVLVPRSYKLKRDSFGRITHWEDADGYTIDSEYAPTPPFTTPDAPGLKGWLFKSVTYASPDGKRYTVQDKGWVMTGKPTGATRQSSLLITGRDLYCQGRIISIQEWQEQRDRANAWRDWYDSFRRQLGLDPPRGSEEDDVTDMGHYGEGLRTIGGSPEDRLEWIAEHHRRQNETLADAIRLFEHLGEPDYDPRGDIALPGNSGAQRLGLSGRGI